MLGKSLSQDGAVRSAAEALFATFQAAGAMPVETAMLQPADTLLDLYGEDIRARAYVTDDPVLGEQMLRPDFTVPVVQMHMSGGADPARYAYMGKVFRKQDAGSGRLNEYFQVGYEVFDRSAPEALDAEVFVTFAAALEGIAHTAVVGDMGLLTSVVAGLSTSERRRAALMRHVWRPIRFRRLLDRFGGAAPPLERNTLTDDAPEIGLRTKADVTDRLALLAEEARESPIPANELSAMDAILSLAAPAPDALARLETLSGNLPSLRPAVDRLARRFDALRKRGIDTEALMFEGSYGRTHMEYYDGFVFGFSAGDIGPIATGGRYDALTRALGSNGAIPAVGGVVRPDLLLQARSASS
ncbi:ATP phosphoribosyltransferase regulatory subunit [Litoreibacter roseus]|uniref:ATP phosphoribosyltransferase regulatory subunit n=1 Tax=Litoreibacter roseus TaxID=2601869 RepID=UPI001FA95D54|nr:ATP phosphoribosyltransferase regulatory subunit [Litoreibacter roseus]